MIPNQDEVFPHDGSFRGGLLLRDYFAVKALSLMGPVMEGYEFRASEWAYKVADAMLEARRK